MMVLLAFLSGHQLTLLITGLDHSIMTSAWLSISNTGDFFIGFIHLLTHPHAATLMHNGCQAFSIDGFPQKKKTV